VVIDPKLIDEAALTALGSRGVLRIGDGAVQVVVGPIADQLASEIRAQWRAPSTRAMPAPAPMPPAAAPDRSVLAEVLVALGGRGNITGLHANSTRLVISVRDPAAVDESALGRLAHAIARPAPASVHLILGPEAPSWRTAMETLTN